MKTHTTYECEICHQTYKNKGDAEACESRGVPTPLPVGLIFGNPQDRDHHSKDLTFCIASNEVDGHWYHPPLWACRDNGAGDSLGKELCGGQSSVNLYEGNAVCESHPTFKRMVEFLRSWGIKAYKWDGKKIVPV
jgi:hypothetical protein